jgi:hypothetical protein
MSLKSTKTLPENYRLYRTLTLLERKNLIMVNIWGVVLFLASAVIFPLAAGWLSESGDVGTMRELKGIAGVAGFIGMLLAVMAVMIVLHEGLHGLFFWLFTRERPKFAFKGFYAYAAMPGWYFPRQEYLTTALAPLVGITVLGIAGLALLPGWADTPLIWLLILNTSGAVGDLWIAWALVRAPSDVMGQDNGDSSELFLPGKID